LQPHMPLVRIACIVEGRGEAGLPGRAGAAEIVIRRIVEAIDPQLRLDVPIALRIPRGSLIRRGGVEDAAERAARRLGGDGAIMVLLDSDDDPREVLEADLLARARQARPDLPIAVVAATSEFEAWFLAAAASLAGIEGLPVDLRAPPNPEGIRDAKGWLKKRMAARSYSETIHQPIFARCFDLQAARTAPSFAHCCDEIARLVAELQQSEQPDTADEARSEA